MFVYVDDKFHLARDIGTLRPIVNSSLWISDKWHTPAPNGTVGNLKFYDRPKFKNMGTCKTSIFGPFSRNKWSSFTGRDYSPCHLKTVSLKNKWTVTFKYK